MATRTISVAGGNWDNVGTWDEGAVPVDGDAVVARAGGTSGQLTVNVASACTSIDFTNYTNTVTFNANLTTKGTTKFVSGMTVAGSAGTLVLGATCTLTSAGKSIPNLQFSVTSTITLADNADVTGAFTLGTGANAAITINSNTLRLNGSLTFNAGTSSTSGTSTIRLGGTGTWSHTGTGQLKNSLTINTSGTVTVSGTVLYNTGTVTYTAGTVNTAGSTISIGAATTLDTNGMTWGTVSWTSGTLTLNSLLSATTLSFPNATATLAGVAGFTVTNITNTTLNAARTYTLTFGNTYTVTGSFANVGTTAVNTQAWVSSTPGSKVVLTVQAGATIDLLYANPTDIDSSSGQQVFSARGVITTSNNWTSTLGTAGPIKHAGNGGGLVG